MVLAQTACEALLLSCVAQYTSCSPQERLRMAEVIADTCNLSEDDESPQHAL